jgi:predicted kinase
MDLVILIGLQGAGKSSFYRATFAATHALVSKDLFPNNYRPARRQQQLIEDGFHAGRSVVVDNTNATKEDRAALVALGRAFDARVIGYYFESRLLRAKSPLAKSLPSSWRGFKCRPRGASAR